MIDYERAVLAPFDEHRDKLVMGGELYPLQHSFIFRVPPDRKIIFWGFDFPMYVDRDYAPNRQKTIPFQVCVHKVVVEDYEVWQSSQPTQFPTEAVIVAESPIIINGENIALSCCNTEIVVSVPGFYRLWMNDQSQQGLVRVYGRALPNPEMTRR